MPTPTCPRCQRLMHARRGRFGAWWQCTPCDLRWACDAQGRPLGTPADTLTRTWRQRAHSVFDQLWASGRMERGAAYAWLAAALGLPRERCHIRQFDQATCQRVVSLVQQQDGLRVSIAERLATQHYPHHTRL